MEKNNQFLSDDQIIFRKWINNIKKIKQDTVFHIKKNKNTSLLSFKKTIFEENAHSHYFSYKEFPILLSENPVCYVRSKHNITELNRLKKGQYLPDITLDLHGLNQEQAKKELGKLITICHKEGLLCASIIHGYGKNILKHHTPFWLVQHPDVMAFHEAPKIFGSSAAILVLINVNLSK